MTSETIEGAEERPSRSVYRRRGNPPAASVLYVHYLDKKHPPFDAYRFEGIGGDIEGEIAKAVARIQHKQAPPPLPQGPDGVEWTAPSYAAFVLTPDQGQLISGRGVSMWYTGSDNNHAFFNGADIEDVHGCSAVYCLNFRLNKGGRPLDENDREPFKWQAHHTSLLEHNGSGTNVGP